ncbi:hypothetical protein KI387_000054 [Taxus chinensis]|uniref:3-phosphoshikimate 1-carboxyvinyltransferase n=1 Tax=Taxus chinensis TaxID=29808 RepID=A0AA38GS45_TAXCH|nr:hypothetical protein KI387_000054 [Taxus chinensis]
MGTSTQDVATTITIEVPSVPSSAPPSPPHVTQATTPLVVSSPPSSTVPPSSSSIFSSLADLSPSISSLISQIPSTPTVSSPTVTPTPVSVGGLTSLTMPPPSVSTHFPKFTVAAPSTFVPSSPSGPTPLSPEWISKHLSQHKRKVPIAPMDFSVIPTKGAKKQKPITRFSQSASGERVMEITYPDPTKDKKDLSPTYYTVTQIEFVLEKIDKIKEEALDAMHQMEQIVLRMSPSFLTPSYALRKANDTIWIFKEITSQGLGSEATFDAESINNLLACHNFFGYLMEVGNEYFKLPERLRDEQETCEVIGNHTKGPAQDQLQPMISKFMEYHAQFHISSPEQKQDTPFQRRTMMNRLLPLGIVPIFVKTVAWCRPVVTGPLLCLGDGYRTASQVGWQFCNRRSAQSGGPAKMLTEPPFPHFSSLFLLGADGSDGMVVGVGQTFAKSHIATTAVTPRQTTRESHTHFSVSLGSAYPSGTSNTKARNPGRFFNVPNQQHYGIRTSRSRIRKVGVCLCSTAAPEKLPKVEQIVLPPINEISGTVKLPGSKSLSNRILLLAALSEGTTIVDNLLDSDDVRYMIGALKTLGLNVEEEREKNRAIVEGCAGRFPVGKLGLKEVKLFLGNAGTAMRPLTAAVTAAGGASRYILDGIPRMRERPIGDLVLGLKQLGADVGCVLNTNCPPVYINAKGGLPGGTVKLSGSISSQYLTALLMTAPLALGDVEIEIIDKLVSIPYVEMTLKLMERFGVKVDRHDGWDRFSIKGGQVYKSPGKAFVEGDASSASYFLAGAAITGGTVTVEGCGTSSLQGDVKFAEVLEKMGAKVTWSENRVTVTGPPDELSKRKRLIGIDVNMNKMPDVAMTLAVVALFADGPTAIRDGKFQVLFDAVSSWWQAVANWRVKETERMVAICTELRKLGATVEEGPDYCIITPPEKLKVTSIDTYDDHRMAMAFSLAACGDVPVTINDPSCTRKTFPDYFDVFRKVRKP